MTDATKPSGGTFGLDPSVEPFKIYTAKPTVKFLRQGVQPPSQVYVSINDNLVVSCATTTTNEVVTVSYRLLRADGELVMGQFNISPANNRSIAVHSESLAEGFLLSVSLKAAVARTRGQTFCRVFLTDPVLGPGQPSYMLMADYVTTAMAPGHPNGRVSAPSEGPGNLTGIFIAPPAPGQQISFETPVNTRWLIRGIIGVLTTDATVFDRQPIILIANPPTYDYEGQVLDGQPASSVRHYSWAPNVPYLFSGPTVNQEQTVMPIPSPSILFTNGVLQTAVPGMSPTDQWQGASVAFEEWLDNV